MEEAVALMLAQPGPRLLSQRDVLSLSLVNKRLHGAISALCLNVTLGVEGVQVDECRWFLDKRCLLQPGSRRLHHPVLAPLVMEGIVSYRAATEQSQLSNSFDRLSPELRARAWALAATGKLSIMDIEQINSLIELRSRRKLSILLSSGSIWAMALGLAKPLAIVRLEPGDVLAAVLGIDETKGEESNYSDIYGETEHQGAGSASTCALTLIGSPPTSSLANRPASVSKRQTNAKSTSEKRSLEEEWQICYWLWKFGKKERNPNVRSFLKKCLRGQREVKRSRILGEGSQITCALAREIIKTSGARQALVENVISLSDCVTMYNMSGIGHIKQVLSSQGITALKNKEVTMRDLMRLPKHSLVKAVVRYPHILPFSAVASMQAPIADRTRMVEQIVKSKSEWESTSTARDLLSLPSLVALEFVLSPPGLSAIRSATLDIGDLNSARSKSSTFSMGARFQKKHAKVLLTVLDSKIATDALEAKVVTIPELLQNIENIQVLSVVLSPSGMRAIKEGNLKLKDLAGVSSASSALSKLASVTHAVNESRAAKSVAATATTARHQEEANVLDAEQKLMVAEVSAKCSRTSAEALELLQTHSWDVSTVLCKLLGTEIGDDRHLEQDYARTDAMDSCALDDLVRATGSETADQEIGLEQVELNRDVDPYSCFHTWNADSVLDSYRSEHSRQSRAVQRFMAETHNTCTRAEANQTLESYQWDVARALEGYREKLRRAKQRTRMENLCLPARRKIRDIAVGTTALRLDEPETEKQHSQHLQQSTPKAPSSTFTEEQDWGGQANDEPTSEKLGVLLKFFDITGIQKEEEALSMLRMCNWRLEDAVNTFLALQTS